MMKNDSGYLDCDPIEDLKACFDERQAELNKEKQKIASDKFNNPANSSSHVQKCPLANNSTPKSKKDKKQSSLEEVCNFNMVKVSAGKWTTNLPMIPDKNLKVVSGYRRKRKKISCEIVDLVGPCKNHRRKTFDIRNKKQRRTRKVSFRVESIPYSNVFHWGNFFPWNPRTSLISIRANTCGNSISPVLKVYPDIEIKLDIPINFGKSMKFKTDFTTKYEMEEEDGYEVKLEYNEDGVSFQPSINITNKYKVVKEIFNITKNATSKLASALDKSFEFKVLFPQGKIHYDFTWKENEKLPFEVSSEWHLKLEFDPIIGIEFQLDIVESIIAACTPGSPIVTIYTTIKKLLTKNGLIKVELLLALNIEGKINMDIGLKKEISDKDETGKYVGTGIKGSIVTDLFGTAGFKIQIIITLGAMVRAGFKSGIEAGGEVYCNSNLFFKPEFKFLGIGFYYGISISAGYKINQRPTNKRPTEIDPGVNKKYVRKHMLVKEKTFNKEIKLT